MSKSYGLPYMGSKNSIVDDIIFYILQRHYDNKYFIDLFAGGFAVSHYVLENTNKIVYANDLNKYVIAFIQKVLNNDLGDIVYDFVSRETFIDVRDNPGKYDEWYVGYVLTIWSFGNNLNGYMYGQDIEQEKKSMHDMIVFNKYDKITKPIYDLIPNDLKKIDYKSYKNKRLEIMPYVREVKGVYAIQNLIQLERAQNLERLDRVQNLERLDSKHWLDFIKSIPHDVLKDSVIYCDPPYEDTAEYMIDGFNHDEFWEWFRTTPYSVYVSSYKAPSDIKPLNYELKLSRLAGGSGDAKVENIYFNGKGKYTPTFEDLLFNE